MRVKILKKKRRDVELQIRHLLSKALTNPYRLLPARMAARSSVAGICTAVTNTVVPGRLMLGALSHGPTHGVPPGRRRVFVQESHQEPASIRRASPHMERQGRCYHRRSISSCTRTPRTKVGVMLRRTKRREAHGNNQRFHTSTRRS